MVENTIMHAFAMFKGGLLQDSNFATIIKLANETGM